MTISKIVSLFIIGVMLFSLVACGSEHKKGDTNNGGTTDVDDIQEEQKVYYVYSVVQKKLHLPDCSHVKNIGEDLRCEYSGDISVLFERGYTICKDCLFVDSSENDDEDEDEEFIPDADEVSYDEATYVINRSNLKIHEKDCSYIKTMSAANLKYTYLSYEELIDNDHVPCGHCMEDEYEEYIKTHPSAK